MKTILVASRDEKRGRHIKYCLLGYGYQILNMTQEQLFEKNDLDLDMLFLDIEDVKDLQYIKHLKQEYSCGIIVLIDSNHCDRIVAVMNSAADDYILKPLRENELIAKVKYHMEKSEENTVGNNQSGLIFNEDDKTILIRGEKIQFTNNEFRLCKLLVQNCLTTVSKESIYDSMYAFDTDTQIRTVTEYIYSVRRKFKMVDIDPIKTIWGIGYRWIYEEAN